MHVFCMASVLHHTSFLTTRLAFKLRGLHEVKPYVVMDLLAKNTDHATKNNIQY